MMNKRIHVILRALISAVICLTAALALAYAEMALICYLSPGPEREANLSSAFSAAFSQELLPMLQGGGDFMREIIGASVPALIAVGAAFAWQAGLYNLGGAGQYALGLAAAAGCAALQLPWYVCVLAGALIGGLSGLWAGWLKNRFRVHEGVSTALMTWLFLLCAAAAMKAFPASMPMETPVDLLCPVITAAACALLWLWLHFTAAGLSFRVRGQSETVARYAGINTKAAASWALAVSGMLCGLSGGLAFSAGLDQQVPGLSLALSGATVQGLAAAVLGNGHPLGALLAALILSHLCQGAARIDTALLPPETMELIIGQVLYLGAFIMALRRKDAEGGQGA